MEQDLSNTLPQKIHVSNKVLGEVFPDLFDSLNNMVFEVIIVWEDGNWFIRFLSQKNVFWTLNPDLSGKVLVIQKICMNMQNKIRRLFAVYCIFDMWIIKLKEKRNTLNFWKKHWRFVGDRQFIKLFSLRFGLHVVCFRNHKNQAKVFLSKDDTERIRMFCRKQGLDTSEWYIGSNISLAAHS